MGKLNYATIFTQQNKDAFMTYVLKAKLMDSDHWIIKMSLNMFSDILEVYNRIPLFLKGCLWSATFLIIHL